MSSGETTVRARELGLALRRAVTASGLNTIALAARLGCSISKVERMFSGRRSANEVDVSAVLALCGITGPARDNLLTLAREARRPGWWQDYDDRLPAELRTLIDYETSAITITNFADRVVSGLLQAPGYARALCEASVTIPETEIDERVAARGRRQQIFDRAHPPRLRFFIDEYALRRTGPGRQVMSEQVHHLLRMSVRRSVEIRVIPDAVGFHASRKPFHLMEFTELHPVVFLEDQTSALFLERPSTISAYRRMAGNLDSVALSEGQSKTWIVRLARELGAASWEESDDSGDDLAKKYLQ